MLLRSCVQPWCPRSEFPRRLPGPAMAYIRVFRTVTMLTGPSQRYPGKAVDQGSLAIYLATSRILLHPFPSTHWTGTQDANIGRGAGVVSRQEGPKTRCRKSLVKKQNTTACSEMLTSCRANIGKTVIYLSACLRLGKIRPCIASMQHKQGKNPCHLVESRSNRSGVRYVERRIVFHKSWNSLVNIQSIWHSQQSTCWTIFCCAWFCVVKKSALFFLKSATNCFLVFFSLGVTLHFWDIPPTMQLK